MKKTLQILFLLVGVQMTALLYTGILLVRTKPEFLPVLTGMVFLFILADTFLFQVIRKNARLSFLKMELEYSSEQKAFEDQYIQRQDSWRSETRQNRIKLSEQLSQIVKLLHKVPCAALETDYKNQLKHMLTDMGETVDQTKKIHYCDHMLSNIILCEKIAMARKKQITATVSAAVPEGLGLTDMEWCSLWCNLLDNAIEACERIEYEPRWLSVKAAVLDGYFYIKVENSVKQGTITKRTSKKDMENHGFGHIILEKLAEKYGGGFSQIQEGERYSAIFSLLCGEEN